MFYVIISACIALLLLHNTSAIVKPRKSHLFLFASGFASVFILFKVTLYLFNIVPDYLHMNEVKRIVDEINASEKPYYLFAGSSHSVHGLDEKRLESKLNELGVNANIGILAAGGMTHLERKKVLKVVKSRINKPIKRLFVEISWSYGVDTLALIYKNPDAYRYSYVLDLSDIAYIFNVYSCERFNPTCIYKTHGGKKNYAISLKHIIRGSFNIGIFDKLVSWDSLNPKKPSNGFLKPHKTKMSEERYERLKSRVTLVFESDKNYKPSHVMAGPIADINDYSTLFGWPVSAYPMPALFDKELKFTRQLCKELTTNANIECVKFNTKEIVNTLSDRPNFHDSVHLTKKGRELFNDYAAQKIVEHLQ